MIMIFIINHDHNHNQLINLCIWNLSGLQNSTTLGGSSSVTSPLIFPGHRIRQETHKQTNILHGFEPATDQEEETNNAEQQHEHRHHRIAERLVKRSDPPR